VMTVTGRKLLIRAGCPQDVGRLVFRRPIMVQHLPG